MASKSNTFISDVRTEWHGLRRKKKWLYVLYALVLTPHLAAIIGALLRRFGFGFIEEYTNPILIFIALCGCFSIFWQKLRFPDLVFIFVIIVWHQLSPVFYPETAFYANENAISFIFSCLPLYFVGRTFDENTSNDLFVLIAYIGLFLEILFLYAFGMEHDAAGNERTRMMSRAYGFLPFLLLLIWNAFERGGLFNYVATIIGIFILFTMGTRGPILCLVFFVAIYMLLFKKYRNNVIIKTLIALFASVFYVFSNQIILFTSSLSSSLGLSTRVFDSIINSQMTNIAESSGRDSIFQSISEYIANNNLLFNAGFYVDRVASGQGSYAHNFELEILCDFGIIGGGILLLFLFFLFFKAFRAVWGSKTASLLLVFFCASIMQLQFSGSFLLGGEFWLFLGMCVSMSALSKNRIRFVN